MAHKKGVGSSRNGRDSNANRLGIKVTDGQSILAGGIILRQRGTKTHPGLNVKRAGDDTLFSTADGIVKFSQKGKTRKIVNVLPVEKSEYLVHPFTPPLIGVFHIRK